MGEDTDNIVNNVSRDHVDNDEDCDIAVSLIDFKAQIINPTRVYSRW